MADEVADNVIELSKEVTVTPAVTVSSVTVERLVDLPGQKIVRAFVKEIRKPLVLWEGDAYDKAGDWTQSQANARILAIIAAGV